MLVVGCGATRAVGQSSSVTTATATTQPSIPLDGEPLIWYRDSLGHLVALDWTGKPAGQVALNASTQTPDGSKLSSASGEVYDAAGHLVGHTDFTKGGGPFWADDSRRVCSFVPPGADFVQEGPGTIWLKTLDGQARSVTSYGTFTGNAGPEVLACSITADRVVLAERSFGWVTDVSAFTLSTGARLFQRTYPAQQIARVSASRDGVYLVEDRSVPGSPGLPGGGTVVRSLPDGTVLTQFADLEIIAFSWEGSVAVMLSKPRRIVEAMLWRSGSVLWSAPFPNPAAGPQDFVPTIAVLPRPGSSDVAVSVSLEMASSPMTGFWLISGGTGRLILSARARPAFQASFF